MRACGKHCDHGPLTTSSPILSPQLEDFNTVEANFRQAVSDAINGARRQTNANNIFFIAPSPRILASGQLELVILVMKPDGSVISGNTVNSAVVQNGDMIAGNVG